MEEIGVLYTSFEVPELPLATVLGHHVDIVYKDVHGLLHHVGNLGVVAVSEDADYALNSEGQPYYWIRPEDWATYRVLDVDDVEQSWQAMREHYYAYEQADIDYVRIPGPNSNSLAASILHDSGLDLQHVLGVDVPENDSLENLYYQYKIGELSLESIGFLGAQLTVPEVVSDPLYDLVGSGGADTLVNKVGVGETVCGYGGKDLYVSGGNRSEFVISDSIRGYLLQVNGVSDELVSIERLQFDDLSVALDIDGNAGMVARAIGVFYGEEALADRGLVGKALHFMDMHENFSDLVEIGMSVANFASHEQLVGTLYHNIFHAAPSESVRAELVGLLNSGEESALSLAIKGSLLHENYVNVGLVGMYETGLEYIPYEVSLGGL